VREERAFIPLRDGARLAARLWLPDELPAAVLLEALPYRMDDLTSSYAAEYERLCGEHGFAVCRLDLRGTGSSDGLATDEYPPQELDDLADAIAWLADADWSTGRVGMWGTSYSGFNSLQAACERPPALGAVAAIYATDDRYTDDVHYTGGALRGLDLLDYVLYMAAITVLPPVPSVYGDGWREAWRERAERAEPWLLCWLEEQADGPYWRHGSLRPEYGRIACPTLLVGGWADGYRNNTLRTFAALECPKRMLVGPWSHMSPATSLPGPNIDLVPELARWFRRWLRDEPTGVDEEPPIQIFVRRSTRPAPDLAELRGAWRNEDGWPLERGKELELDAPGGEIRVEGDVGTSAWISCAGRLPWGQPTDQREDDARALAHDWEPLADELEILGHARVRLRVESAAPVAFLSAKLCDVFPDGTSALVTRGFLNLAHRRTHAEPEPFAGPEEVEIELEATSWVFESGQRVRLSLAGADWPNIWPPPSAEPIRVTGVTLVLPTVPPGPARDAPAFAAPPPREPEDEEPVTWRIERDVLGRETRAVVGHGTAYSGAEGARVEERYDGEIGVSRDDPARGFAQATARYRIAWPEAEAGAEARLDLRSDALAYAVTVEVVSEVDGERIERRFTRQIPRQLQ
jgi:predicted acyl esterase